MTRYKISILRNYIQNRYYSPFFRDSIKIKSINVTGSACDQLRALRDKFPEKMLRVAVEAGGCHGFQYKFMLDEKCAADSSYVKSSLPLPESESDDM